MKPAKLKGKKVVEVDEALQGVSPSENPSIVKPEAVKAHEKEVAEADSTAPVPDGPTVELAQVDEPAPVNLEASGPVDPVPAPEAVVVRADHSNDPIDQPAPVHTQEDPVGRKNAVKFIKNINPREEIVFNSKTKESVTFPEGSTVWMVSNKELADKLRAVAGRYGIIEDGE